MDRATYLLLKKKIDDIDNTEKITAATEAWLEDNVSPETGYVLDRSLTLNDAAAPADLVGEQSEKIEYAETALIDVVGVDNTKTITKLTGLNNPANGTAFVANGNYETYYVPITKGLYYTWTANKSVSANPSLRLSYSQSVPSAGVACTFISEQAIFSTPIKFTYYANADGYLCISVWKNETDTSYMSVKEEKSGILQTIDDELNVISDKVNNPIFVGTSARTVEVETNTIKARKLIDYEGESTQSTWPGGLAIYKNLALIGYNFGYFAAFDLTTGALIATGQSPQTGSHNNNLFFDTETIINGYPVVYSSYCIASVTYCYVYSISISGATITLTALQRLQYSGSYFASNQTVDWCYDEEQDELVAVISENGETVNIVTFKKPLIFHDVVELTDDDVVRVVTNSDITVRQGCAVSNSCLFMLNGSSNGNLLVIDLKTGSTINDISLSSMSSSEPEGIAIANGKVYVNFHIGQDKLSANLYEMKF